MLTLFVSLSAREERDTAGSVEDVFFMSPRQVGAKLPGGLRGPGGPGHSTQEH